MPKVLISIIIPLHNEEKNIPILYKKLKGVTDKLGYNVEIIIVDDGSVDDSFKALKKIQEKDARLEIVQFTRNFGKEMATTAGIHYANGDACIIIDADLQHPPELIPEFIRKWEGGAEVVIGIRKSVSDSFSKKVCSYLYYKTINRISDTKLYPNGTDFQLLDRIVIDEFNKMTENRRITRGLINWLGFRKDFIYFDAPERAWGKSGYGFFKRVRLASHSIVNLSLFPLRLAGYLGIFITLSSAVTALFVVIEKYVMKDPWGLNVTGIAILVFVNLVLVGIILICLGLIALYIANIHNETLGRPLYVIRRMEAIETKETKR